MGVRFVNAVGEADPLLAYLSKTNISISSKSNALNDTICPLVLFFFVIFVCCIATRLFRNVLISLIVAVIPALLTSLSNF
jgi:hypothetical protein